MIIFNTLYNTIISFFGSTKNIILALLGVFITGYTIKQKYDTLKAQDALLKIEKVIIKNNTIIARKEAENEALSKEISTTTEIENLKELYIEKEKARINIQEIAESIKESRTDTVVNNRVKGEFKRYTI